jgi:membrane carboxypeptidase/penicillin-binding protein PbpC
MGIGTLEVHPIDLLGAYGAIANQGLLMPRQVVATVTDAGGNQVWPAPDAKKDQGKRVISRQAAYIISDILAGNTDPSVNPFWAEWRVTDGVRSGARRPAAYKTGTTSDNRDVHAYGFLAPPKDKDAPALAVGVWMGNSNNEPNKGSLSLDSSAPLWSAILSEVSKGEPIAAFPAPPKGVVTAKVDAFTGLRPGPATTKTVTELFVDGTVPKQVDNTRELVDIDEATGLLWADGCTGPKVTEAFLDFSWADAGYPAWQRADRQWEARARSGPGRVGTAEKTHTSYFYGQGFYPWGQSWGGKFAPTKVCEPLPPPSPSPGECLDPLGIFCPSLPPEASPSPEPKPSPSKKPKP